MSGRRPQSKFLVHKSTEGVTKYPTYNGTCRNNRAFGTPHAYESLPLSVWRSIDHLTVFRELTIIKALYKLTKHRDNWKLVGRSCIEELAKCSEHKFLINSRPIQTPQFAFLCPEPSDFTPDCCDKWSDHAITIQSNPLNSIRSCPPSFLFLFMKKLYSHVRICSSSLSRVIDSTFPRGFSSGRRDKEKKPSAKDRRHGHSTESVSNPSTNVSSISRPIHSG